MLNGKYSQSRARRRARAAALRPRRVHRLPLRDPARAARVRRRQAPRRASVRRRRARRRGCAADRRRAARDRARRAGSGGSVRIGGPACARARAARRSSPPASAPTCRPLVLVRRSIAARREHAGGDGGGSEAWNLTLPPLGPRGERGPPGGACWPGACRLDAGLILRSRSRAARGDRLHRQRWPAARLRDARRGRGDPGRRPAGRGRPAVRRPTRRCTAAPRSPGSSRSPASRRCRSCGRCTRRTRGSRPTARSPTWPRSPAASRPCGSSRAAGRRCSTASCSRSPSCASTGSRRRSRPGWLAEDEIYARLREPYGYWNAVGVTAAMGIPLCLWLGTREGPPRCRTRSPIRCSAS